MRSSPRDSEIEDLLRREARRFDYQRDLDHDPALRMPPPDDVAQPTAEPATVSPSESSLAPFSQHFKSAKQAADQAAAEKFLEDLARFVDRGPSAPGAGGTGSLATRLLTKIKPVR